MSLYNKLLVQATMVSALSKRGLDKGISGLDELMHSIRLLHHLKEITTEQYKTLSEKASI